MRINESLTEFEQIAGRSIAAFSSVSLDAAHRVRRQSLHRLMKIHHWKKRNHFAKGRSILLSTGD